MGHNTMPSENEWIVMEVLWENGESMTASEIIEKLDGIKPVSPKTIRVLINRLLKKQIINFRVDPEDARVYHYFPVKTREECLEEKSDRFLNSYFKGNPLGMVAAFVENNRFTKEQIDELIGILRSANDAAQGGDRDL